MKRKITQTQSKAGSDSAKMKKENWLKLGKLDAALGSSNVKKITELFTKLGLTKKKTSSTYYRWEDDVIEREIPEGASVLDLGCGEGMLLKRLIKNKNVHGQGVELDSANVRKCVENGVPVFQIDLSNGLKGLPDNSYEYVILEETLQTLSKPEDTLKEMLRVGKRGIVSFPNFGFWRVRFELMTLGRMPVTDRLPFKWYNTPNIHMLTLQDFIDWTKKEKVKIAQGFSLTERKLGPLKPKTDNLYAEEVLIIIE
ncbi:MAG: methionine biosynthesis protein MetW [Nitrospinota bacterium]